MSTWFITGCSTGLGRALAQAVLEHGFNAAVTARRAEAVADIVAGHGDRALALALDVSDHGQAVAATRTAMTRFDGIDVLVNNAGYGYRAAVEEGEPEAIRAMFDTNFFGAVDLIQQVLPSFRERGSGLVVNMSSIGGRLSNPGSGFYSASKYALEGLSYGLRLEVEPLGIKVMVVEPGPFRTDFAGRSLVQPAVPIQAYAATAGTRRKENDHMDGNQAGDPAKAAQAIIAAAAAPNPPHQLLLGNSAVDRMLEELGRQQDELAAWETTSRATDFE
ncbi:MAG: SDR family NAD(P)-dependent oxidoreductase [Bifidobacteriaceae bacterium]|jgi:NAD(P)-dependent dehydrogenase (short-subunit alcohol dehydrogenase family)|nr:SDR family NAD(P)-dependent oxidoreductase [Bifidobacteriaceae bacterium]